MGIADDIQLLVKKTTFKFQMATINSGAKNEKALIQVVCMINQTLLLYCFTMVVYGSLFQRQEEVRHESTLDVFDEENYELTLMERVDTMKLMLPLLSVMTVCYIVFTGRKSFHLARC